MSLYAVIIANIWLGMPFNMILLSVGLAGIPDDVYEAAELDGADAHAAVRHDHAALDARASSAR